MTVFWIVSTAIAYLLGSIPSGLLLGRLFFGIDIREFGSRRTGATNVLRTVGKKAAVAAVVMDMAKGAVAVLIARWLLPAFPWAHVTAALAVMVGHNWPIFVGFRGGRGVLVSFACVAVLYFPMALILLALGLLIIWRTRYVSLASIAGAAITPVCFVVFYVFGLIPAAYVIYAVLGAPVIILAHKDNLERLLAGKEARFGQRVEGVNQAG